MTSTKEMLSAIIAASPRPAEGYHRMLHLCPEIFQRFIAEEGAFILIGAALPVGVPTGVHFDGCEIILDMGTAYGEVTIEPDKPKTDTLLDRLNRRLERWEGKWD